LCYIDLDQFKIVNDNGHEAGDKLLCQVTALLQTNVRVSDTRVWAEMNLATAQSMPALSEALHIANTLRQSLQEFRFVCMTNFSIGASIGLLLTQIAKTTH